ncbi:hypothetical protein [Streptomyces sp. NPDC047985]|uniref:hypothetical protein n=1 Tax=Streptomyces sp. NPDC047985 TaxID=3155384 RepID=UPI003429D5E9
MIKGFVPLKTISNKVKHGGIAVAILALLASGYIWHHGRTPAARLAKFCGGALPVEEMLEVTGTTASGFTGNDLGELHSADFRETGRLGIVCSLSDPEPFRVSIEATEGSNPYFTYTFQRGDDVLPVPLGNNWSGILVPSDRGISGSVVLDCPGWEEDQGRGILVSGEWNNVKGDAPIVRTRLAKVLTSAAQRTAEQTGCKALFGNQMQTVDPAATRTKRADQATGTCKGVTSRSTVWETAARTAPVEYCVLKDGLRLAAFYGAFADSDFDDLKPDGTYSPSGENSSSSWGTAECPGGIAIAQYAASPEEGGARPEFTVEPPTAREYADLRTFAEQSAKRHGCTDLKFPSAATR